MAPSGAGRARRVTATRGKRTNRARKWATQGGRAGGGGGTAGGAGGAGGGGGGRGGGRHGGPPGEARAGPPALQDTPGAARGKALDRRPRPGRPRAGSHQSFIMFSLSPFSRLV